MAEMGRPSLYRPEYAVEGRLLAIRRKSDEQMAQHFGVGLATLAQWAWESEDFYNSITPSAATVSRWRSGRAKARKPLTDSGRIQNATRARMWAAIKGRTDGKLFSRLPYTLDDLVRHLSGRMTDGMTLANYGKWHVDHIRPCASFDMSDPDQFAQCWGLDNLQPLWASDNSKKGAKWLS